jgi:hypothetical protein
MPASMPRRIHVVSFIFFMLSLLLIGVFSSALDRWDSLRTV